MSTVTAVQIGEFIHQYQTIESVDKTLRARVSEVFGSYVQTNSELVEPEPVEAATSFTDDLRELADETTGLFKKIVGVFYRPESPPLVLPSGVELTPEANAAWKQLQSAFSEVDQIRSGMAGADMRFQQMKEMQFELQENYPDPSVLNAYQLEHIEKRYRQLLEAYDDIVLQQQQVHTVLEPYADSGQLDRISLLRQSIARSVRQSDQRLDRIRSNSMSDGDLLENFNRLGGPIVDLLRAEDIGAVFSASQLEHLFFLLNALERGERLSVDQVQCLLQSMEAIADRKYRLTKVKEQLTTQVSSLLYENPTITKTIANTIAFGVGFLLGGIPTAVACKMAVGGYVDGALDTKTRQSQEAKVAEAVVEGITGAVIAGPEGVVGSVATSAVQAAPQAVQDVAMTGSLAYLAKLSGISPYSAAQLGFMGTLAVKRQGMVKEILRDCRKGLELLKTPKKIPRAMLGHCKRWVSGLNQCLRAKKWEEASVRFGVLLAPAAGWLIGLTSIFTGSLFLVLGLYLVDKFFKPMKRYEGTAELDNPAFLAYVVNEFNRTRYRNGHPLERLKEIAGEEMRGDDARIERIFEQYPDLYRIVQEQVEGLTLEQHSA